MDLIHIRIHVVNHPVSEPPFRAHPGREESRQTTSFPLEHLSRKLRRDVFASTRVLDKDGLLLGRDILLLRSFPPLIVFFLKKKGNSCSIGLAATSIAFLRRDYALRVAGG